MLFLLASIDLGLSNDPPNRWGGDCSWCFPGTVHLVLQEEARAAASTDGISTGWPRKHIAIVATQIFSVNK